MTQFWDPDDDAQFAFAHAFTKKLGQKNWLAVSCTPSVEDDWVDVG